MPNLRCALSQLDVPRVAVVGVGQALCGDDGAGPAVIARLISSMSEDENLLLLDCGHAPENCLGQIIGFKPDHVVYVDAVRSGATPGEIRWFELDKAVEIGGSTHTLSLGVLSEFITHEIPTCKVSILGIQPQSTNFGDGLSNCVNIATISAAEVLADYWRKAIADSSAMREG